MKIAVFSTLWGSSTGGIDVFSRELIEVLASQKDMDVCAFYLVRTPQLVRDSKEFGFLAVTPSSETTKDIDASSLGSWTEEKAKAVILQVCYGKQQFPPDVVILNDVFGREALQIVRDYLPNAKIVTLFHTAYGRSEGRKGVDDSEIVLKENFQRELVEHSDLALSVGSFAIEYLKYLAPSSDHKIDHILPGLPKISSTAQKTDRFNAISFGRLDRKSDTIKQISVSAEAWSNARDGGHINKLKTDDVSFFAIGSRGKELVLQDTKQALESTWRANVRELPFEEIDRFDDSELKRTLERCSFALLNSWYENFGLTFLETCTFGLPTIISESSGFYVEAKVLLGDEAEELFLVVKTDGVSRSDLIQDIEKMLISAASNYEETFENAKKLSDLLKEKWPSWRDVTEDLLEKIAPVLDTHLVSNQAPNADEAEDLQSKEKFVASHPWKEDLGVLMEWCWSSNLQYYRRLMTETDAKNYSKFQLTGLQKKLWDRKEEILESGFKDIVLSGGTSSGKTTLAEMLFGLAKPNEFSRTRILYIAPTKALAQEKARIWRGKYPSPSLAKGSFEPVIVSTGDDNASDGALVRGDFNIASTVYEKANVILSANQDLFDKLNLVVIDEFHMIEDLHRGSVLESVLAKFKKEKKRRLTSVDEDNHLRLVIITTEGTSERLAQYLTYTDLDTLEEIAPLVISDKTRAKPVSHHAFFPGKGERISLPLFDIKEFGTEDHFLLEPEEAAAISADYTNFRATINQIDESADIDRRQLRWDQYLDFIDFWINKNPTGKRLLIFMNSKYAVVEVAKFIKNRISKRQYDTSKDEPKKLEVNEKGIEAANLSLDEVEQTDFVQDLRRCANEGVFIHNADVPQAVRSSFEEYLARELSNDHRSEIVFATETLSYGVNLQVTDVALFNVLFPEGERIQTKKPPSILLSRCDFVNMSGRAGRLGQSTDDGTARVSWYLDPEDEKSFDAVLKQFYVDTPAITSNLFHRTDTDTFLDQRRSDRRRSAGRDKGAAFDDAVEKYSYPFVRTVLDGLRFLGGVDTRTGVLERIGCTEDELIQEFFENSFYFYEKCEIHESEETPEEDRRRGLRTEYLEASIRHVLKSATLSAYSLVREPKTGGYQITPLGCSTIDTGTEIGTVSRLRQSVLELNHEWERHLDQTLPFEMAVLPVFFQPEVHRQYLLRLPELSHAMEWNPVENRRDLINRAIVKLEEMGAVSEVESGQVETVINHFVNWTVANQPIASESRRGYEEVAHDGCLRLYLAFLAWISGVSLKGVIGEVQTLYPSAPAKTDSSVFNFEAFAENLTWKILFLISLIRSSEERILPPSSTFDAVRFIHRSRFGCVERAIPLLFKNRTDKPPLNRVDAHNLLSRGISTANIAIGGLSEDTGLTPNLNRKITMQVRRFIDESFQEIARQFNYLASGEGLKKANEDQAKAYWEFAQAQVRSLIRTGQKDDDIQLQAVSGPSDETSVDEEASNAESKLVVSQGAGGVTFEIYSPKFDDRNPEKVTTTKTSEFAAHFVFEGADPDSLVDRETRARTIFIDFPWAAGATVGQLTGCRLSPAAFGIVLSVCARNFVLDVSSYLQALTNDAENRPIGVRELYRISEPHLRKNTFPEAIFEAWAKYIEVGEF